MQQNKTIKRFSRGNDFTLKTKNRKFYDPFVLILTLVPSPVVSTEASPASPPSSFYPSCIFCPLCIISRRFPTPSSKSVFDTCCKKPFVPHRASEEKNIHPRRREGGRVRTQRRPFRHQVFPYCILEDVCLSPLCLPVYVQEGFSSLVAALHAAHLQHICADCISGLYLPRPPVPPRAPPSEHLLLFILFSVSRHRVQLWPSQGAFAGSHLTGPWPQDDSQNQHVPYMRDKATQTPRAWADERRRGSHKRSASCGSTDQLKEIAKLRQQLQRSKRSSRHRRDKERKSPFNGSHTIIQSQSPMPKTILIPIPISKSSAPRFRNSVEGLNQEIERIIIRDTPEKEETIVPQDVPDGHRAPPPVPPQRSSSTRSIDTQTPSGGGLSGSHSNCSSRPDSISPSYLTVLNDAGGGSPYEDKELGPYSPLPKYAASPRPNNSYMFKREPPEGCEKVKVFEESMPKPLQEIPPFLCPDRNKVNFIPNSGSAFCLVSILKPLLPAPELSFRPGVGLRSLSPSHSLVPLSTQPCLLEEPESF